MAPGLATNSERELRSNMVRKLRGGNKKETKSEKKDRRAANAEAKERLVSIVLPVCVTIALLVAAFVYWGTR